MVFEIPIGRGRSRKILPFERTRTEPPSSRCTNSALFDNLSNNANVNNHSVNNHFLTKQNGGDDTQITDNSLNFTLSSTSHRNDVKFDFTSSTFSKNDGNIHIEDLIDSSINSFNGGENFNNFRGNNKISLLRGHPVHNRSIHRFGPSKFNRTRPLQQLKIKFDCPQTPPSHWAVVCFDDFQYRSVEFDQLDEFCCSMIHEAFKFGLEFNCPLKMQIINLQSLEDISLFFEEIHRDPILKKTSLLFSGIASKYRSFTSDQVYQQIKFNCDYQIGIISQCFKMDHITNTPVNYFDNLLLKVNGKLGGQNYLLDPKLLHELPLDISRTLIVGVVSYPVCDNVDSQWNKLALSVAVGSYDQIISKYTTSVRVHVLHPDHIILTLGEMFNELIEHFVQHNHHYPCNLVILREGVHCATFEQVLEKELNQIRSILTVPITITLVVVQKRRLPLRPLNFDYHHSIIVDDTLLQNSYHQYQVLELCSFFKCQQCTDCTRFVVLLNELGLATDVMLKLLFYSCHNYCRSRSCIDVPTAVRYCNLCFSRVKMHLDAVLKEGKNIERNDFFANNIDINLIASKLNNLIQIKGQLKNKLYFC